MKKLLLFLVLAASVVGAEWGQITPHRTTPLITDYDLDSTTLTYCVTTGTGGGVLGDWIQGRDKITTSGSTVTTTALAASTTDPFFKVAAGDELLVNVEPLLNGPTFRYVATRASADSITVNAAWDLSGGTGGGYTFSYRTRVCGTAATSGWIPWVSDFAQIAIQIDQSNVTGGILVQIEGRMKGAVDIVTVLVGPELLTTTGITPYNLTRWGDEFRVGIAIGGPSAADDGDDLTVNTEKITVKVTQ